ncbi:hypothetical protein CL654_03360 [bacterium]|nr:hypothetical protein [bacterium]|tara:strand:- start:314 stop:913 length:600 start_codon:yes stop_codon:yes gene_type:complete
MLNEKDLRYYYVEKKKSSKDVARVFKCSENKVNYWLKKYGIPKRSISEAVYLQQNPQGDPFTINKPKTKDDYFLYGLGIGLYWGEGNKKDRYALRLGNTDPALIKKYLKFIKKFYNIPQEKLRFGIQVFSDTPQKQALNYWKKVLGVDGSQFIKTVITPSRGKGSYRTKVKYGVLTVYISNKKLRNIVMGEIEKLGGLK